MRAQLLAGELRRVRDVERRAARACRPSPASIIPRPSLIRTCCPGARRRASSVAIIGAGGIGFDVATFLTHRRDDDYFAEWGIDRTLTTRGGVVPQRAVTPPRQVYLLQRKAERLGATLGKTTGWIHRTALKTSRRGHARRRELRAHRRCGPAHRQRARAGIAGGRPCHHLRRPGVGEPARGELDGAASRCT